MGIRMEGIRGVSVGWEEMLDSIIAEIGESGDVVL